MAGKKRSSSSADCFYDVHSWDELKKKAFKGTTVIIPLGATEAHGKHAPVGTDSFIPTALAVEVAGKTNSLVLPPVNYGFCYTLRMFPGTISLRSQTLRMVYEDVVRELVRNGFRKILFLNGHGGNSGVAKQALKELSDELKFKACLVDWWHLIDYEGVGHADAVEAFFYDYFSEEKRTKKAKQEKHNLYVGAVFPTPKDLFTPSGYMGSMKPLPKKKGEKMVKEVVGKLVEIVKADLALKQR